MASYNTMNGNQLYIHSSVASEKRIGAQMYVATETDLHNILSVGGYFVV